MSTRSPSGSNPGVPTRSPQQKPQQVKKTSSAPLIFLLIIIVLIIVLIIFVSTRGTPTPPTPPGPTITPIEYANMYPSTYPWSEINENTDCFTYTYARSSTGSGITRFSEISIYKPPVSLINEVGNQPSNAMRIATTLAPESVTNYLRINNLKTINTLNQSKTIKFPSSLTNCIYSDQASAKSTVRECKDSTCISFDGSIYTTGQTESIEFKTCPKTTCPGFLSTWFVRYRAEFGWPDGDLISTCFNSPPNRVLGAFVEGKQGEFCLPTLMDNLYQTIVYQGSTTTVRNVSYINQILDGDKISIMERESGLFIDVLNPSADDTLLKLSEGGTENGRFWRVSRNYLFDDYPANFLNPNDDNNLFKNRVINLIRDINGESFIMTFSLFGTSPFAVKMSASNFDSYYRTDRFIIKDFFFKNWSLPIHSNWIG